MTPGLPSNNNNRIHEKCVIEILSSSSSEKNSDDDDNDNDDHNDDDTYTTTNDAFTNTRKRSRKELSPSSSFVSCKPSQTQSKARGQAKAKSEAKFKLQKQSRQAAIVLEEDIMGIYDEDVKAYGINNISSSSSSSSSSSLTQVPSHMMPLAKFLLQIQKPKKQEQKMPQMFLFTDTDFATHPNSIYGSKKNKQQELGMVSVQAPVCYCRNSTPNKKNNNDGNDEDYRNYKKQAQQEEKKIGPIGNDKGTSRGNNNSNHMTKKQTTQKVLAKLDVKQGKKSMSNNSALPSIASAFGTNPFMYRCAQRKCKFYANAFVAEQYHWYRFGPHTGHCIVRCQESSSRAVAAAAAENSTTAPLLSHDHDRIFSANDLQQGRVGDCWFLSALAVVAERPDLISRLFPVIPSMIRINSADTIMSSSDLLREYGIVQVNLFLDGFWKPVIVDNFFPCIMNAQEEAKLQETLQASMNTTYPYEDYQQYKGTSSKDHPRVIADECQKVLRETHEFLEQNVVLHHGNNPQLRAYLDFISRPIRRSITSGDLAYSKASHGQLWVPLLEKAYAKSHGSYQAISGGHIAEAFLDLTGAPTKVFRWLDSPGFNYQQFWSKLMKYRKQRLPMGCGTDQSQVGIIGMHAYSILDVVEIHNVSHQFYYETGAAHGGFSGFGMDGIVRLLQIRNPHGKGEWKGHFSDHSNVWEKLVEHSSGNQFGKVDGFHSSQYNQHAHTSPTILERTKRNDGKFWIDYDSFLQGFSNVDVVLAFQGHHAKSFLTNFPSKTSNHRCTRAFEVSLVDPATDVAEIYVMGIQKTRRGAGHGRVDRKVSYKVCDLGLFIGECQNDPDRDFFDESAYEDSDYWLNKDFMAIHGHMFGFQRNGHHHLILRRDRNTSFVVMPVSFGHPAATDEALSFVLRFVSDSPILIKELPAVPRINRVIHQFCMKPSSSISTVQGKVTILVEGPAYRVQQIDCLNNGGGVVFLYLDVDAQSVGNQTVSLSMKVNCRGMSCRTGEGLLQHKTVAKGRKFEASWREFAQDFLYERQSRLLAVIFQSGQDFEFGGISCDLLNSSPFEKIKKGDLATFLEAEEAIKYQLNGIFQGVQNKKYVKGHNVCNFDSLSGVPINDYQLQQALILSSKGNNAFEASVESMTSALKSTRADSMRLQIGTLSEEEQIQLAIERSTRQKNHPPEGSSHLGPHEVFDLTNDDV